MTETAKHTPGPYRRHDMERYVIVAGKPGGEVASTENGFGDRDANRDFLIHTANCHAKMLAALKECAEYLGSLPAGGTREPLYLAYTAAETAIAEATGD